MIRKKIVPLLLSVLFALAAIAPISAEAATQTRITITERGTPYISFTRNVLYYSYNGTSLLASDPTQSRSGFLAVNRGFTKITSMSSSTRHTWNFKNEFLVGAVIGGVTLGFGDEIIDQARVYNTGAAYWSADI